MTKKIRVLLAEDQSMLRGALAALLSIEPDIEVLDLFPTGSRLFRPSEITGRRFLVADIEMPKIADSNSPPA